MRRNTYAIMLIGLAGISMYPLMIFGLGIGVILTAIPLLAAIIIVLKPK